MIAYMVTNLINGKRYIGITTQSLVQRWRAHVKESRHNSARPLQRAIAKHGVDAFVVEQIASASCRDDLMALEMILIQQENTLSRNGFGYNATIGGDGVAGYAFSEEQKAAMSETHKARTDPHMQRLREGIWTGKKHTPETIAKMAVASTGFRHTPETRQKLSEIRSHITGWKHTPETRAKISLAHTGKTRTPEHCAAISAVKKARVGWHHSPETRAKMSESAKAYRQRNQTSNLELEL